MSLIPLPKFSELPLNKDDPPNSAWGLWGKNGLDDQLGTLNYLTDALVLKTMKEEIQTGKRVGLKYVSSNFLSSIARTQLIKIRSLPLDFVDPPLLGRVGFSKQIIRKDPRVINDDVVSGSKSSEFGTCTDELQITFNTQGSSQWDSFRHFAYQKQAVFYNGITQDDVHANNTASPVNGIGGKSSYSLAATGRN